MPEDQIKAMLASLLHMRRRPGMYLVEDYPAIVNFMTGFQLALRVMGHEVSEFDVLEERGWERDCVHPVYLMQKKGLTREEITQEILTAMIVTLQRRFDIPDDTLRQIEADPLQLGKT